MGRRVDQSAASGPSFTVQAQPDQLRTVALVNSETRVGAYGELRVSLVAVNPLSGGANLLMRFPKWGFATTGSYFKDRKCVLLGGQNANIDAGATCTLDTRSSTTHDSLSIENALSSDVIAG